jgi:hypothetical protein
MGPCIFSLPSEKQGFTANTTLPGIALEPLLASSNRRFRYSFVGCRLHLGI